MIVKGLQIIESKGAGPTVVDKVETFQGTGIVGDYHGRSSFNELEISFFPVELEADESFASSAEGFCFTRFVPNIYTEGLLISDLEEGDVLQVGETWIEIVEIEGDCHFNCPIRQEAEDSDTEGISAESETGCNANVNIMYGKVVKSGEINVGDTIEIVEW